VFIPVFLAISGHKKQNPHFRVDLFVFYLFCNISSFCIGPRCLFAFIVLDIFFTTSCIARARASHISFCIVSLCSDFFIALRARAWHHLASSIWDIILKLIKHKQGYYTTFFGSVPVYFCRAVDSLGVGVYGVILIHPPFGSGCSSDTCLPASRFYVGWSSAHAHVIASQKYT